MLFLKKGEVIMPASPNESVIHSFTSTFEFCGAFIKMNIDFTPGLSGKTVDLDNLL